MNITIPSEDLIENYVIQSLNISQNSTAILNPTVTFFEEPLETTNESENSYN